VTTFYLYTTVVTTDVTSTVDQTVPVTSTEVDTSLSYTTTVVVPETVTATPPAGRRDAGVTELAAVSCPTTAAALSTVPAWASACKNRVAYSSACSCVGAVHATTTLAPCTTTKTLTHTITSVSTVTNHPTATVRTTVPVTVTTTTTVHVTSTATQTSTSTSVTTATSQSTVVDSVVTMETVISTATTSTSFTTVTPSPSPTSFDLSMTYTDGTVYYYLVDEGGRADLTDGVPSAFTIDQNGNLVNLADGRVACILVYTFTNSGDDTVYFIDPSQTNPNVYAPMTCQQPDWTATSFSISCSFSYGGNTVYQFEYCSDKPELQLAPGLGDGCIEVVPVAIPPS
jgi:hypothetical protein